MSMSIREGEPLNYKEQGIFAEIMNELEAEHLPADGWQPESRPNPLAAFTTPERLEDARRSIPKGHIALQGDFDQR
jgi:hypothetical protein